MQDVLDHGTTVQCIVSAIERSPTQDRKSVLTKESLTQTLESWLDGPIAKGMFEVRDDLCQAGEYANMTIALPSSR